MFLEKWTQYVWRKNSLYALTSIRPHHLSVSSIFIHLYPLQNFLGLARPLLMRYGAMDAAGVTPTPPTTKMMTFIASSDPKPPPYGPDKENFMGTFGESFAMTFASLCVQVLPSFTLKMNSTSAYSRSNPPHLRTMAVKGWLKGEPAVRQPTESHAPGKRVVLSFLSFTEMCCGPPSGGRSLGVPITMAGLKSTS